MKLLPYFCARINIKPIFLNVDPDRSFFLLKNNAFQESQVKAFHFFHVAIEVTDCWLFGILVRTRNKKSVLEAQTVH